MLKVFISQPMAGKTDDQILTERKRLIKLIEERLEEPFEIVATEIKEKTPVDNEALWYLGKSLQLLATADVAFFANGWVNARGCRVENRCAYEYGIKVMLE